MAATPAAAPLLGTAPRSVRWLADEQLMRLASRGHQAALGAIYERYCGQGEAGRDFSGIIRLLRGGD